MQAIDGQDPETRYSRHLCPSWTDHPSQKKKRKKRKKKKEEKKKEDVKKKKNIGEVKGLRRDAENVHFTGYFFTNDISSEKVWL